MGQRVQKDSKSHKRNKRARRAAHKAADSGKAGRKPAKGEPGINDADLIRIVGTLWPDFNRYLDAAKDFRRPDRIVYPMRLLLFLVILERIMGHTSNRQHDQVKREDKLQETVCKLTESYPDFLPHSDTIKYLLERMKPEELGIIRLKMINQLLRGKRLNGMRTGDWLNHSTQYYRLAIDGVHYHTSHAPIEHSTHRNHANEKTEYMLMALEASIVSPDGIRIPLMTEFIENPDGEYDKQDCELKAAKRLMQRIKNRFNHLRLIILLDGLYLCEDILNICRANRWELSVTVNKKTAAFLEKAEERMAGRSGRHEVGTDPKDGRTRRVSWCNGVEHVFGKTPFTLNVIKMVKDNGEKEDILVFATTIYLSTKKERTWRILDEICRTRWQIEEAFKVQKHHGLALEALFGTRGYAGQNYYLVVQIADIIRTFILHSTLFRRLQQYLNNEIKEVIQRSMLDWYGTIAHFVDRFRRAILAQGLTDIDMDGWRLSYDTG